MENETDVTAELKLNSKFSKIKILCVFFLDFNSDNSLIGGQSCTYDRADTIPI